MTDREKLELAEVFTTVLDHRLQQLRTEIAVGFTQILEYAMEDLAKIFEKRRGNFTEEVMKLEKARKEAEAKKARAGF